MGHEVQISTFYGLQGEGKVWQIKDRVDKNKVVGTVPVWPSWSGQDFAIDFLASIHGVVKPDILITNMDVWVVPPDMTRNTKFAPWLPIDHDPVPKAVIESLVPAIYPMAYSKWGVEKLKEAGIEAHYVPCSVDCKEFRPKDRKAARKALTVADDVFLVVVVAANKDPQDRKGLASAVRGFAEFAKHHSDARLFLHTQWGGAINVAAMVQRNGLGEGTVIAPDQLGYLTGNYSDEFMATLYSAADVLLNPAKSEGFGLPMLEAQACGCPIAATDFSTTDELLFAGWKIAGQLDWTPGAESYRMQVYHDSVVESLEAAYAARNDKALRQQARAGALSLDTQAVALKYWKPALAEIEAMINCKTGKLELVQF
jgi:glycosyltransferase involved in cell wall biosynthesis